MALSQVQLQKELKQLKERSELSNLDGLKDHLSTTESTDVEVIKQDISRSVFTPENGGASTAFYLGRVRVNGVTYKANIVPLIEKLDQVAFNDFEQMVISKPFTVKAKLIEKNFNGSSYTKVVLEK